LRSPLSPAGFFIGYAFRVSFSANKPTLLHNKGRAAARQSNREKTNGEEEIMASLVLTLLAALCQTATGIFALWALFHIPKMHRRLNAQLLANQEAQRVAESIRAVFQGMAPRTADPRLSRLMVAFSQCLPGYVAELPALLAAKSVFPSLNGFVSAPTYFLSSELRDAGTLDKMVAELNDPVLNMLWEIRSPSALSEMLRYCLELAQGGNPGVAGWSQPDRRAALKAKHRELWNTWGANK
jgi:hypothetical protein